MLENSTNFSVYFAFAGPPNFVAMAIVLIEIVRVDCYLKLAFVDLLGGAFVAEVFPKSYLTSLKIVSRSG
jgi:hypothetical protein